MAERVVLVVLAIAVQAADPPTMAVLDRAFLIERVAPDGSSSSEPATVIPAEAGACYRWLLRVKPRVGVAQVDERLELPAPASHWGGVDGDDMSPTRLSPDRRVATTSLILPLTSGVLTHGWCYAEGDPIGAYSVAVSIDGRSAHRFDFTVGDPGR